MVTLVVTRSKAKSEKEAIETNIPSDNFETEDTAVILSDPKEIEKVLKVFHDTALGGHKGFLKTYFPIRKQFKWEGMQREIKNNINACKLCQKNKSS